MAALLAAIPALAQEKALVNTSGSPHAVLSATDIDAVNWTGGFWKERFDIVSGPMAMGMWETLSENSPCWNNFLVAAGDKEGNHGGPQFYDGDFYKWFEGLASVYAITKNPEYDAMMDRLISVIARCQREDGYIHTPAIIKLRQSGGDVSFEDRLNFETYNLGHLMTAACVHYRATGKRTLLDVAKKAADFLYDFCRRAPAELAGNAICPAHYMGVMEMYRLTGDKRYLDLARQFIEIRALVENGTDDNQDRIPFRQQKEAMGHAVRANYLYAGVADVVAETGDEELMANLESIWKDITGRKMYVTGACGALYDGTSPDGTSYSPNYVQKVHQSYGRAYQLPHSTAHNESCANIGNLLFNWRMFTITGDAKYMDIVETVIYNSLMAGVSLDGLRFFYTNPLRVSSDFPYTMRWSKDRTVHIPRCFCCPPNTFRTMAEIQDYAYAVSADGLWVNLYGSNSYRGKLPDGSPVILEQKSEYPWKGKVEISLKEVPAKAFAFHLYIPEWAAGARVAVNGDILRDKPGAGTYFKLERTWKAGDVISVDLPMETVLLQAGPLVEEARGQVAVKRGPVVYCIETADLEEGVRPDDILIPTDTKFAEEMITVDGSALLSLTATVYKRNRRVSDKLYAPVNNDLETTRIRLVPYYAWDNRGKGEMSVWIDCTAPAGISGRDVEALASDGPYALHTAIRDARNLRRTGKVAPGEPLSIVLKGGTYFLAEPINLRAEDGGSAEHPFTIRAAEGEKVTISGGMPVTGWKKARGGKLWVAPVPAFNGNHPDFRQVWVNGRKAVWARDVADFENMSRILSVDKENEILYVPAKAVKDVKDAAGVEMVLHQMWAIANLRVKSISIEGDRAAVRFQDPESRIQFEHPWPNVMTTPGLESPFYLQGAKELLDAPGEWWHDASTHQLYYYPLPGEDMASAEVIVPVLETIVNVEGTLERPATGIRFENITFSHTGWMRPSTHGHVPIQAGMYLLDAYKLRPGGVPGNIMTRLENQAFTGRPAAAVVVKAASDVDFQGCRFEHLASCGLDFEWAVQGGGANGCVFTDIGGNGLQIGTFATASLENHLPWNPEDKREVCDGQAIRNNHIYNVTNEDWGCCGIAAGFVADIDISHNLIHDISYTGISLGWGWTRALSCMHDNLVSFNHIYNYAAHMYDTACIYTLSAQPRTTITGNWCHSIFHPSYVHSPNHWFYLYTDEGSSYIEMKGNLTESEKFLRNANGPGVVWEDNGPDIKDAAMIREKAGLEPEYRHLAEE